MEGMNQDWNFEEEGSKEKTSMGGYEHFLEEHNYNQVNCLSLSQFPHDEVSWSTANPPWQPVKFSQHSIHNYFQIYTSVLTTGWCKTVSNLENTTQWPGQGLKLGCSAQCPLSTEWDVQLSVHCPKHWPFTLGHPVFHMAKGHIFIMFAYFSNFILL